MLSRTFLRVVAGGVVCGALVAAGNSSAKADEPLTVQPAIYRTETADPAVQPAVSTDDSANVELVRWRGGRGFYGRYGGYGRFGYGGYGRFGGYGYGGFRPYAYRPYGYGFGYGYPPVYPPVYGYGYGYGYPGIGFGLY